MAAPTPNPVTPTVVSRIAPAIPRLVVPPLFAQMVGSSVPDRPDPLISVLCAAPPIPRLVVPPLFAQTAGVTLPPIYTVRRQWGQMYPEGLA